MNEMRKHFRQYESDMGRLSEADFIAKWKTQLADEGFQRGFYEWLERKKQRRAGRARTLSKQNKTLDAQIKSLEEEKRKLLKVEPKKRCTLEDIFSAALHAEAERNGKHE